MAYDPEKARLERAQEEKRKEGLARLRTEKTQARMSALCAGLERALEESGRDPLARQADILDELFRAVLQSNLHFDKTRGCFKDEDLDTVLRIQKQCAETVRIDAASRYMRALTPPPLRVIPAPAPPLPPSGGERNE